AVFGGRSIWQGLTLDTNEGPFVIGADIDLGNGGLVFDANVPASLERNTSKYVLSAVSSLLNREFASEPLYRKPGALKFKTVELRINQPDSVEGALLEALAAYEQQLILSSNR
ncbi:MAG: hypothetical protein NTW23_06605, partial [Rhodoluna sp.]|nr:hypothetical protein [Rhodoluna sp.]